MTDFGSNPMRHDCKQGERCFNRVCRPKIDVFAECFPGRVNFGDVDGLLELDGHLLLLEWKSYGLRVPTGQRLMHDALIAAGHTVVVVEGDAETMVVRAFFWRHGRRTETLNDASLDLLKTFFSWWAEFVRLLLPKAHAQRRGGRMTSTRPPPPSSPARSWRICPSTGKRCYPGARVARTAHRRAGFRIKTYQCPACGQYHIANLEKQ